MEIKEKIIALRKEGYSVKKISEMFQIDERKIYKEYKKILEQNLLTEGDIEEGKKKKRRRALENNSLIMKIFELKKQGVSGVEIAKKLNISNTTISKYTKEGIELGIIDEEEIKKAKMKRKELKKKEKIEEARQKAKEDRGKKGEDALENEKERNIDKEKLLSCLILGYNGRTIKSKLGILSGEKYQQVVNELIKEKRITKKEMREYRKKREEQEKETVFEELKKGKLQSQIAEIIKETEWVTRKIIKKVKEEKNISDEDILRWKNEKENSAEKEKKMVLEGLIKGLSYKEMIEENQKEKLTSQKIQYCIDRLVREGGITREKIKEYRQARNKERLTLFEKEMLNYLKNGYGKKEILDLSGKSRVYVNTTIRKLKEKGKITEEEIKQARIRRKEEKEKAEQKKAMQEIEQQVNKLKREIDSEIRFGKNPSQEKLEKMREYINLCQERYQKENITRPELLYLGQVLQKVEIKERDLLQFVKFAISIGEYQEALNFVRLVQEEQTRNFSESGRQKVKKLEEVLSKANKVKQALQIIKRGNTNTAVLSNATGLSKDEINILKIRTIGKPIRIAGPIKRRKILEVLITEKDPVKIQEEIDISDFEMEDMQEQKFEYKQQKRNIKKATSEQEKQEIQEQIEKNTRTRVVVLYTKIGKKPEFIAKVLKKEPEEIQEDLDYAIEKGMIKEEQLQGIDPLVSCSKTLREELTL